MLINDRSSTDTTVSYDFTHESRYIGILPFKDIKLLDTVNNISRLAASGEVSEWLIEQPWKGCVGLVPTGGSNPPLSVF